MPISTYIHLEKILHHIVGMRPTSVLDVGVGFGKWGCLVREYVDGWCYQRYNPKDWKTVLHGIEIFEGYCNPIWKVYDRMFIGNVLKLTEKPLDDMPANGYDLVIMIDVLEHVPRDQGLALLNQLRAIGKKTIFSYFNSEQSGVCENVYEDHISKWSLSDFTDYSPTVIGVCPAGQWGILVI